MIRFLASSVSSLSLLASGILIWQSGHFPERLPKDFSALVSAFFSLFQDPFAAGVIFVLVSVLVMAGWCITELLLGALYAIAAGALAFACLLGFLSTNYPNIQFYVQEFVK